MEDAIAIVMRQCEMWTDNAELDTYLSREVNKSLIYSMQDHKLDMVAEEPHDYGNLSEGKNNG